MTTWLVKDDWLSARLCVDSFRLLDQSMADKVKALVGACSFISLKTKSLLADEMEFFSGCGFRHVCDTIQFKCNSSDLRLNKPSISEGYLVREALEDDEAAVRTIAGLELTQNRFYADPLIDTEKAKCIKSDWASSYFRGARGVKMVVACFQEQVIGFVLLDETQNKETIIDLIAVKKQFHGLGVGTQMLSYAHHNLFFQTNAWLVGTDAKNNTSKYFYERVGFKMRSAISCLHMHS